MSSRPDEQHDGFRIVYRGTPRAIVKDVECARCGTGREAELDACAQSVRVHCATCGKVTAHVDTAAGGQKLKPFITEASYSGRDFSGDFVPAPPAATYGATVQNPDGSYASVKGAEVTTTAGTPVHQKLHRDWQARHEAKRDRKLSDRRRARGDGPVFIDQKTG